MTNLRPAAIDIAAITVSGLSAGAYMAHQLLVAYSDVFSGMGSIAGGPYLCSNGTLRGALTSGMRGDPKLDVASLVVRTRALEQQGLVADLRNLERARIWVFHGTGDHTVLRAPVEALVEYCGYFTRAENIRFVGDVACRHTMPTDMFDPAQLKLRHDPYINRVGYDAAGALLRHLYGPLRPRTQARGRLVRFDQEEFVPFPLLAGMGNIGFVYYPTSAFQGTVCKLHVALHGCEQYEAKLGIVFAEHAGYNEWAEANDIIVLYPQTFPTVSPFVFNPKGSWDWFGMLDCWFCTRLGRQQRAIVEMVGRLAGTDLTSRAGCAHTLQLTQQPELADAV